MRWNSTANYKTDALLKVKALFAVVAIYIVKHYQ